MQAFASTLTISQDGPNLAVDPNFVVGTGEWRLKSGATALPNTTGKPANASLVFAYSDPQNYYYANYSAAAGVGLGGFYRIAGGARTSLATFSTPIVPSQLYNLEIRHKDGAIRAYIGTTFLLKIDNVAVAGTKLGVATEGGNTSFGSTVHSLGPVDTPLVLSLVGGNTPVPTPPTVQITAPVGGITVSSAQTVSAAATDTQGVSSVQFKLDGNNLGAADTTAPYATTWDTHTATNASHSLTAVATNVVGLSATASSVNVLVSNTATPPPTSGDFTISASSTNAGIDSTLSTAGVTEWRLSSHITLQAGDSTTPANASLIFGYSDPQNFYYANFSAVTGLGLSGVYRVTDGVAHKILGYNTFISPGQAFDLEVRFKDNTARLYLNGVFLNKAEGITGSGPRVGMAAFHASAVFAANIFKPGALTQAVSPVATTVTAIPENVYDCLPAPVSPLHTASTGRQVHVFNAAELKAAIIDSQPGDTITMADGVYANTMPSGNFTASFAITQDGTAASPITLTGGPGAIIDGDGPSGRYGLYLNGADHWNLVGFTVANSSKGIVLDGSSYAFLENMHVQNIGQEAVHFRAFSSNNVVKNSAISSTGRTSAQFGEGVYIGSASGANWSIYSGGLPDASDHNTVIGNTFTDITAEAIDLKEGSSSNYIASNSFDGSSLSGENSADSWVDVKGHCNLIEGNIGINTLLDGYQVHNVFESWASYNVFRNNTANVNAAGYGYALDFNSLNLGNLIECSNTATAAGAGLANVPCVVRFL